MPWHVQTIYFKHIECEGMQSENGKEHLTKYTYYNILLCIMGFLRGIEPLNHFTNSQMPETRDQRPNKKINIQMRNKALQNTLSVRKCRDKAILHSTH